MIRLDLPGFGLTGASPANDYSEEKLFGSKLANKYIYQPIYRLPQENDDEDDSNNKKKVKIPKHPYMKLKLD